MAPPLSARLLVKVLVLTLALVVSSAMIAPPLDSAVLREKELPETASSPPDGSPPE
jgi:hypothetical protein